MTDPTELVPVDIDAANERAQQVAFGLKAVVRELTGGWGAWLSNSGVYHATRGRNLTNAELERGLSQTIHADTARGLADKIREEASKESRLPANLA